VAKKYGEDWRESGLHDDAAEEFGEWVEGHVAAPFGSQETNKSNIKPNCVN